MLQDNEKRLLELIMQIESAIQIQQSIGDWIDEKSAQRLTGLKKSSLFNLRKSGKIRFSRLTERKVFYSKSDLEKLLNDNEKSILK
jgi:hypothetical protein